MNTYYVGQFVESNDGSRGVRIVEILDNGTFIIDESVWTGESWEIIGNGEETYDIDYYLNGVDDVDSGEMDGDHDSAMTSIGWGTDEDYGYFGEAE